MDRLMMPARRAAIMRLPEEGTGRARPEGPDRPGGRCGCRPPVGHWCPGVPVISAPISGAVLSAPVWRDECVNRMNEE